MLLGWMRQGQAADKSVEKAEEDIVEREDEAEKTDELLQSRFGSGRDVFDADQSDPRSG